VRKQNKKPKPGCSKIPLQKIITILQNLHSHRL